MIKRYCDKCGKEINSTEDYLPTIWWTLTRHGYDDITVELCNECYRTAKPYERDINVLNKSEECLE